MQSWGTEALIDLVPVDPDAGLPRYTIGHQGISVGWADVYESGLPCQWIDVTGVPPGDYKIRISLNFEGILAESNYSNNFTETPFSIP